MEKRLAGGVEGTVEDGEEGERLGGDDLSVGTLDFAWREKEQWSAV